MLKPRFEESTEAVWRPKRDAPESNTVSTKVDQSVTKQEPSLLQRSNYVPVDQCTEDWRALRVGKITASKVPALLGFCGIKLHQGIILTKVFSIPENLNCQTLSEASKKKARLLPSFLKTLASTSGSVDTSNTPGIKGLVQARME